MFKKERNVVGVSVLFGIVLWILDALLNSLFFYEGTFLELLGTAIPYPVLYNRAVVILCLLIFGLIISRIVSRLENAEQALSRSHERLERMVEDRTAELRRSNEELTKHRENLEELVEERAQELKRTNERLELEIAERKKSGDALAKSYKQLREMLTKTIDALTSAAEVRDPYTAGHQRSSSALACAIAKEMNLPEDTIEGLRIAGIVHDIGKICVAAEILSKPGRISDAEFNLIKNHSQVGHDILGSVDFPWPVADIVLQHHERIDGSGYPNGIKGAEILVEARILGVADTVEAMAAHRPYRPARGTDEAIAEIEKGRGTKYDPSVVDACAKLLAEKRFEFKPEFGIPSSAVTD